MLTLTLARLVKQVKGVGRSSRSNAKNCVWASLFVAINFALRSRSKIEVKVRCQGQRSMFFVCCFNLNRATHWYLVCQRSMLNVWRVAVNIRGSACQLQKGQLPSSLEQKMTVTCPMNFCLSAIGRCVQIISRMLLVSFLFNTINQKSTY